MRKLILVLIYFQLIFICKVSNCQGKEHNVNDKIAIAYKFNNIPWAFKFSNTGEIFITDGYEIARFNNEGKYINSIKLDSTNDELTPIVDFVSIDSTHFYASARGNIFYLSKDTAVILNKGKNFNIRIDSEGNLFSNFQEYRPSKESMYNGFRIKNKNNVFASYPDKFDYSNDNFEIIEDRIMFYSGNNNFFILPIDTTKPIIKEKIPEFTNNEERIWFIGVENDYYVFKYFKDKKDVTCFFNKDLKLTKKATVNYDTLNNVVPYDFENGYYFQTPSGLLYTFNVYNKSIYVLENIKAGIFIQELDKLLK